MFGDTSIVQLMWHDRARITGVADATDDDGFDTTDDVVIADNEPCKVVQKTLSAGNQSFYDEVKYNALLLIRPDLKIPQGADIEVTDKHGNVTKYKRASGGFANYVTHQEVAMEVDDKA